MVSRQHLPWQKRVYTDLHEHPELSFPLPFNVLMVAVAMVAIARTVPRGGPGVGR